MVLLSGHSVVDARDNADRAGGEEFGHPAKAHRRLRQPIIFRSAIHVSGQINLPMLRPMVRPYRTGGGSSARASLPQSRNVPNIKTRATGARTKNLRIQHLQEDKSICNHWSSWVNRSRSRRRSNRSGKSACTGSPTTNSTCGRWCASASRTTRDQEVRWAAGKLEFHPQFAPRLLPAGAVRGCGRAACPRLGPRILRLGAGGEDLTVLGGRHADGAAEGLSELDGAGETGVAGNLFDGPIRLQKQFAGMPHSKRGDVRPHSFPDLLREEVRDVLRVLVDRVGNLTQ